MGITWHYIPNSPPRIRPLKLEKTTPYKTSDPKHCRSSVKAYFSTGVKRLRKLWVDGGYAGRKLKAWGRSLKKTPKIDLEVVEREGKGFQLVKRRWVVERTFAWLLNDRRLSKDYEVLTRNSEAMIQIAMSHLLIKRLAA